MFEEKLHMALSSYGMSEKAFLSLLRDEDFISDNKIFVISRMINQFNPNIILTKKIGNTTILCRRYDIAIEYTIKTTNPCNIIVDFHSLSLEVEYKERKLIIDSNLMDYQGEKDRLIDLRQYTLNEIMIRYFSKILYALYNELRWYM